MKSSPPQSGVRLFRVAFCVGLAFALPAGLACTGQVDGANPSGANGGTNPRPASGGNFGTGANTGNGTGSTSGTGGSGSGNIPGTGGGGIVSGTGGSNIVMPGTPGDPAAAGVRPLRLMTRREYLNTVRDLFGDTSIAPAALPAEDEDPGSAFAFHTTGAVATLDATLYREAAEALAKGALTRMSTLLSCAASANNAAAETTCLNTFMTTLAVKLYRRPLAAADVTRLTDMFMTGKTTLGLNFSAAVGFVIEVVLQSPEFLYHWEVDPGAAVREGAVVKLGQYELANRLSYFLWGTLPDDILFGVAKAGQLGDAAGVDAQVRRMLKDGKAAGTFGDFFVDWLDIDTVTDTPKDPTVYPLYNEALTLSMADEVRSFASAVMVNGTGRFDDLMTGTNSFANQGLATLYGVSGVSGTMLRPVMLNAAQRSGLLTMAGFLSLTGGAAGTDPPRRGKALLYKLLCRTLPPTPVDIPDEKPVTPGVTTRQRFEEHAQNPCATACHSILDPLGFAFENYDGIGQYRTMDNNLPVNASVTLTLDGQPRTVADGRALAAAMATSEDVHTCFSRQWTRYALGRMDTAQDLASVQAAAAKFRTTNRDVRELLVGLATSRTFRYRTPATGEVLQ